MKTCFFVIPSLFSRCRLPCRSDGAQCTCLLELPLSASKSILVWKISLRIISSPARLALGLAVCSGKTHAHTDLCSFSHLDTKQLSSISWGRTAGEQILCFCSSQLWLLRKLRMRLIIILLFGVDWCLWDFKLQAAAMERSKSAKVIVFFLKSPWHVYLTCFLILCFWPEHLVGCECAQCCHWCVRSKEVRAPCVWGEAFKGALETNWPVCPMSLCPSRTVTELISLCIARSGCGDLSYTIDSSAVSAHVLACPSWVRRKPEDLPLGVLIDEDLAQELCDELWLGCLRLVISCCASERKCFLCSRKSRTDTWLLELRCPHGCCCSFWRCRASLFLPRGWGCW